MEPPVQTVRLHDRLHWIDRAQAVRDDFAVEVRAGLLRMHKALPCRFLYDAAGSALFEAICDQPEYYLTRAEADILGARAKAIAGHTANGVALCELGSGSSKKTRLLVESLLERHGQLRYVPIDISRTILRESAEALVRDYPSLQVTAVAAEYGAGLAALKRLDSPSKLVLWLGSNLGNQTRVDAARFLQKVRAVLGPTDRMLIGVDLRKGRRTLERAYDDAAGVTAAFNLNLLARINRDLGGRFDLSGFSHRAVWNEALGRVELFLESLRPQLVRIDQLKMVVPFATGERIHTEWSYKYSREEIDELARAAGFGVEAQWLDGRRRYSVNLLAPLSA